MRRSLPLFVVSVLCWQVGFVPGLSSVRLDQLRAAQGGGDCEKTKSEAGKCTGTTCTPSGAKWIKKTGLNITPVIKEKVAKGADGFNAVTVSDAKDCFKIEECTLKDCGNCSDKVLTDDEKKENQRTTKGTHGGKACKGT